MLYYDLLDCDPQTNSLRYKRVTCGKNYSDRDNGALSSNTLRKPVVSDELKPMKSRHRDREITPTVYMELRR